MQNRKKKEKIITNIYSISICHKKHTSLKYISYTKRKDMCVIDVDNKNYNVYVCVFLWDR